MSEARLLGEESRIESRALTRTSCSLNTNYESNHFWFWLWGGAKEKGGLYGIIIPTFTSHNWTALNNGIPTITCPQ